MSRKFKKKIKKNFSLKKSLMRKDFDDIKKIMKIFNKNVIKDLQSIDP